MYLVSFSLNYTRYSMLMRVVLTVSEVIPPNQRDVSIIIHGGLSSCTIPSRFC
ncbi:uncharacterized protein B0H18DRAFT_1064046 [Fomitopsis serialis]|uniref:uncharacterized protein n=1 Tax=Fomitopsis serialis TaxID=139415 RepID=UPI0020080927|nr:uncharacterized protein B0H18DRAFT_1064046 [Neoantrodia serialis]KAH9911221.1 hypothetical protein B0H18DRAFT_1064046 [Neoantrodia serialis]